LKPRPGRRVADEFARPPVLHRQEAFLGDEVNAMTEATLARAQAGDGQAFSELVDPYRSELLAHCYRILGSFHDAEDMLQEALLAAWRSIGEFDGRALRAWLYRIATNRCLNYLRGESRRPQPAPNAGTADPWWLEPFPDVLLEDTAPGPEARYDTKESIALSFVAGLQRLPPQQRAVLVLRDVLGFPAAEVAGVLDTSPAAVNSALIRARAGLHQDRSPHDVPLPKSPEEAAVVDRFVDAIEHFDLDRLVAVLTQDARLTMPPEPAEFRGPAAIAGFLAELPFLGSELKVIRTRANSQPAFVYYLPDPCAPIWRAGSLMVLTLQGDRVCAITRFAGGGLLARFGIPRTLPRD
jgi:RNA polymerase sigma-70 factor (TIGR02960 family)